jgi:hypothetical protein
LTNGSLCARFVLISYFFTLRIDTRRHRVPAAPRLASAFFSFIYSVYSSDTASKKEKKTDTGKADSPAGQAI